MKTTKGASLRFAFRAVLFFLCALSYSFSQVLADTDAGQPSPSYDPFSGRPAFFNGVAAAKRGDYPEALRLFNEARAAEPQAADIYYNLGLVESMIPGRELRAISWFGAYLAAKPDAVNTAAIRARMAVLEAKSESTIRTFLQLSEDTAKEFTTAYYYDNSLFRSAVLWAEFGDVAALERIEPLIADPPQKSFTLHELVKVHLKKGDIAAAEKVQAMIERAETRDEAQIDIAEDQFNRGDYEGARQTLTAALENTSAAADDCYKSTVLTRMAKVQIKKDDRAGANETLAESKKRIAAFDRYSTIEAQCFIAEAEVLAGDIEAAEKTFMAANDYAAAAGTESAFYHIAKARARTGDISEAMRISDSVVNPSDAGRDLVNMVIIEAQLKTGDIAGAQQTADKIAGYYHRQAMLLINQAKMKRESSPSFWLAHLDDPDSLNDAMFLDLEAEMKRLSLVEEPVTSFEGVLGRARIYLEAHQIVRRMVESLPAQEVHA